MKSHLKQRLLASLLSLSMAFSTPLTSFATGIGGNTGSTDSTGVITSAGGDFGCNINPLESDRSGRIGVRFSLVDNNDPSKVISVDENGNEMVLDLIYATYDQFLFHTWAQPYNLSLLKDDHTFSSVKTQELMTQKNGPKIKWVYGDSELEYDATVGSRKGNGGLNINQMAPWMEYNDNNYQAKGSQFVNWCWENDAGIRVVENGDLYTVNIFGVYTKVTRAVNNGQVSAEVDGLLGKQTEQYSITNVYSEFKKKVEEIKKGAAAANGNYTYWQGHKEEANALYVNVAVAGDMVDAAKDNNEPHASEMEKTYHDEVMTLVDSIPQEVRAGLYKKYVEDAGQTWNPSSSALTDIANEVIGADMADLAEDASLPSHISMILGLKQNGQYLLQTKSMRDGKATDLQDVLDKGYEDWVLLVEPIIWLTIFPTGCTPNNTNYLETKIYGTVSNVMDAFNYFDSLKPYAYKDTFNWKMFKEAWKALCVEDTVKEDGTTINGFQFANGDVLLTPAASQLNTSSRYYPGNLSDKNQWSGSAGGRTKAGFAVNVYWGRGLSPTVDVHTWDGESDSPAPPKEGTATDGIKIVKWYVTKLTINNTIKEVVTNVFVSGNQPRKILCENEGIPGESNFYQLEKWATGKNDTVPKDGDTSTTFEKYYKLNPGEQGGLEQAIVEVGQNDKVLYLKLVDYEFLEEGEITVIKVKEPSTGGTPLIETSTTSPGDYNTEDPGWIYEEDTQSKNDPVTVHDWSDVPKDGVPGVKPRPTIPVAEDTKTLYIRYSQDPTEAPEGGQIILYSNELSYGYTLKSLTKEGKLDYIMENFPTRKGSEYCDGHDCGDDECSGNHGEGWYNHLENDSKYTLGVTSSNINPDFILDYAKEGEWSHTWSMSLSGGKSQTLRPNASYLLYRNKTKDLVTMYPSKNSGDVKTDLARLGINIESYTPEARRIGTTGNGFFYDTFRTNFTESGFDRQLSWYAECSEYECYWSDTVEGSPERSVNDLNTTYSQSNNTLTFYELGNTNTASAAPGNTLDTTFTNVFPNNTNVQVAQDGVLAFYPYIKMQLNDKNNHSRCRNEEVRFIFASLLLCRSGASLTSRRR